MNDLMNLTCIKIVSVALKWVKLVNILSKCKVDLYWKNESSGG